MTHDSPSGTPSAIEHVTVTEAASATGVPVRTLYRWINQKRVRSHEQQGTRLVALADVQALAAASAPGSSNPSAPPATANSAVNAGAAAGTRATAAVAQAAAVDPDATARVFAAIERGEALTEICRTERLPAPAVQELARQHQALVDLSRPRQVALRDELVALIERRHAETVEMVNAAQRGVSDQVADLVLQIGAREKWILEQVKAAADMAMVTAIREAYQIDREMRADLHRLISDRPFPAPPIAPLPPSPGWAG